mgnify:CR=1 FL=1
MSSENYITKLSGLNSEVLEVGEQVVSVDGEELAEGQLVGDFIRAHPRAQYTLGLRVAPVQVPTPSLGELMKTMLSSPEMRGPVPRCWSATSTNHFPMILHQSPAIVDMSSPDAG